MTLATIIETLKMIALKHPNVNSAYEGNIYEILNANPNNKYASVVITQQSHTTDEVYDHYGFVIFYVDRLVDDMEENRVQIQSCGKSMLGNIITFFCEEFEAECDNITYQPFTQKFVDMTCGVYCTITIDTVKDIICPEEYWKEDWVTPVTVIRNQDKRVTFTENGTYTIDYDPTIYTGLGNVEVNVNIDVDSYYNNGYNQGKTDGVNEQKSKLETINITENGTYTKQDGYNHIEVNVPDLNGSYDEGYAQGHTEGYNQGKTDGVNEQKGKLSQIKISENGTYANENGYSEVVVDVPDLNGSYDEGYQQGKTDGIDEQKLKLESISITENGVYSKEDGYNQIEVNVPDLNGSYDEGYQQGHTEGYAEGERIGYAQGKTDGVNEQKGKLSQITISENGTYTNEDGYSHIEVNVPDLNGSYDEGYAQGKTDGINEQKGKLVSINITENGTYTKEDGYNEIVVEVPGSSGIPKVNVQKTGLKLGFSTFKEVPEWADFEGITDMARMFHSCSNLQTIPLIDTSSVTTMEKMLYGCGNLQTIPFLDTSKVSNASNMFYSCFNLITLPNNFNFGNCTNFSEMFYLAGLTDYSFLETWVISPNANMDSMITNAKTTYVPAIPCVGNNGYYQSAIFWSYNNFPKLTYFGGWIGRKYNVDKDYMLKKMPNLTYESCISILNNLYDFTGNGETPDSSQGHLKVHANFLTTVGDEISIGTSRGWTITA